MRIALGFSRTNNLPSRMIRWFTRSQISHTYIRLYIPTFRKHFILHADWDGVKFDLAEKFEIENIILEEYIVDDSRLDASIIKNLWHLGKKYDYIKLFNWAWAIILKRWFIRKVKDPVIDPKKLICTDFAIYIFNGAGITNLKIGHMAPADMVDWCRQHYESLNWKRIVRDEGKTFLDRIKEILTGEDIKK